ncbi:MAG TPA: hypothetical protein VHE83_15255 [Mycobacteriales bacterium]|nr:hypothetical protein [Mycobacteriales bacterium]
MTVADSLRAGREGRAGSEPHQVTLARARLAEAEGLEPADQVALYDDVHQLLQQALEELDASGPISVPETDAPAP